MAELRTAQVKSMKKKRSVAKARFHRIYNRFKEQKSAEDIEILEIMLNDMEQAYKTLESEHSSYIEFLDSDDENEGQAIESANNDTDKIYMELCDVRSSIIALKRKIKVNLTNMTKPKDEANDCVRVKKLEAPTFSGKIREYPSFRNDYRKLMSEDPYALKQCLTGEAFKTIQGVDNDFHEMFKRLDLKYGREERIVEAVLCELKTLRRVADGDNKRFIEVVDIIEKCWLDLKRMKMQREMNTATMMSQIEILLPSIQKREWALLKQKSGSIEFEQFMQFLLREKSAMEYIESDIRDGYVKIKSGAHAIDAEEENSIQGMIRQNKAMMQRVVEGLVQVTEAVQNNKTIEPEGASFAGRPNRTYAQRNNKCWYHESDRHDIVNCSAFSNLDAQTKLQLIRKNGCCFSCLKPGHLSRDCANKVRCELMTHENRLCGKYHHPIIHDVSIAGITFHNSVNVVNDERGGEEVILMVSYVKCKSRSVTTLWDPGSNISLITHRMANLLELTGRDVNLSVTKVGNNTDSVRSKEYILPLTDMKGKVWQIKVYGMDEITTDVPKIEVRNIVRLFKGVREIDLIRPTGNIDLLIGTDCCVLLPSKVDQIGNLQLMKNQFGYCLRGSHSLLHVSANNYHETVRMNHATGLIHEMNDITVAETDSLKYSLDRFFDIESLGTSCSPKCGNCRCGKCPIGNNVYTIQEEHELKLINNGLVYDENAKCWTASYPWKKDPKDLPNNVDSAKYKLVATENRLQKCGKEHSEAYQQQIVDMINRNVARKISTHEIQQYDGPVHYIHHHEVLKPESKSTPVRIVFNSSASYMGHKLNQYWAKGPNVLNDLLGILLRFRQRHFAIAGDISKMYNSVKLSIIDQHTHRFLWRDLDKSKPFDHYVLQTVTFGDTPSGAIATLALRLTAEKNQNLHPKAAELIIRNSYVDDLLSSVDNSNEATELIEQTNSVLKEGGFAIKHWIVSGEKTDMPELNIVKSEQERVLGIKWNPMTDEMSFKIKLNFSAKKNNVKNDHDSDKVMNIDSCELTRRKVLSQLSTVYDPLGMVTPFILTGKLLMRSMCVEENVDWDSPLTDEMKEKWCKFFREMYELETVVFPRCLKPANAFGNPTLVVFSDASRFAYGTSAYIRWHVGMNRYESRLIMSKNRIAPTKQLSIPRLELCAAVLAVRLRQRIKQEMDFDFEQTYHLVDSMIVRAQIQKESYGFKTFVATRIAEIQSKSDPSEWFWIPGDQNPADLTTRPTKAEDICDNSEWQNGPDFMRQPVDEWPIKQENIDNKLLPDVTSMTMTVKSTEIQINRNVSDIDINRFSSIEKLFRVTGLLILIAKSKTFKGCLHKLNPEILENSREMWIKDSQQEFVKDYQRRFQRLGTTLNDKGIIIVGQRMAEWIKNTWNQQEFALVSEKHPLAKLIVLSTHNEDHAGVDVTLAKIRSRYWIPGVRRLISFIKGKCVVCRKRDKLLSQQKMGTLPLYRLRPAPAFYYCAVDLFGPFSIRDTVKRRTFGKAYGILFNCLTTRAVYVDLAEGYDMNSFLIALRRFVSLRGYPRLMISDAGTQLVAAGKELKNVVHEWNWDDITLFGENKGMEWKIIKSADAPWENGCSESLIKSVKKSLDVSIGDSVLTFSELQTVLFEVANLINERPIGTKNCDPNEGTYLCPNDIILGRASTRVPNGSFDNVADMKKRWIFIQNIINGFWKRWMRDYFPSLIVRQKWHTSVREIRNGDLVLVQDSNIIRGNWKLGQVVEILPSRDGKVRDVVVQYKNMGSNGKYSKSVDNVLIKRSVHRLVVILPVEDQR